MRWVPVRLLRDCFSGFRATLSSASRTENCGMRKGRIFVSRSVSRLLVTRDPVTRAFVCGSACTCVCVCVCVCVCLRACDVRVLVNWSFQTRVVIAAPFAFLRVTTKAA